MHVLSEGKGGGKRRGIQVGYLELWLCVIATQDHTSPIVTVT